MRTEGLANSILGHAGAGLFSSDVREHADALSAAIEGRRVLVVGGAGSIGAATVKELLDRAPACVHVVDPDENGLVELVRDLRSRREGLGATELRTLPLDVGSGAMRRFLADGERYDHVLNFAALKHVRSEKDPYSLMALLGTNVLKTARLLRWLDGGSPYRFFAVSTDKAASPAGLMGASKRIMEHAIFSGDVVPRNATTITSARFANVAFSNGSLLAGFLHRMEKGQPLAAPRDTRRFFVTIAQSGWICLLAAVLAPGDHSVIPRPGVGVAELELADVAARVLEHHGFQPSLYDDEEEARSNLAADRARGRYPLLLTPRDTSGEKPFEIFVGEGEETVEIGYRELVGVPYRGAPAGALTHFIAEMEELNADPLRPTDKQELVRLVEAVVPELRHVETGKTLDDRM